MRSYALVAAAITMAITSAGAAGYLSGEFQKAISGTQEIAVKLESMKREQAKLEERKQQIDRQIENLPEKYTARQRERAIAGFKEEQKTVTARITEIDTQLPELQTQQISSSAKAGPIISIAKSFDTTPEEAVKWVILIIILVFDPLAVFLIVAGNFLLAQHKKEKLEASLEAKLAVYNPLEHSAPTVQPIEPSPAYNTVALSPIKLDSMCIDPLVDVQPFEMPPLQTVALESLSTRQIEALSVPQPSVVVSDSPQQTELKLREIETVEELIDVPPSFSETKQPQIEEPVVYEPVPIVHEDPVDLPLIQEQDVEVRIPTETEERSVIKESDILKHRSISSLEEVSAQFGDIVPIEKGMTVSKPIKLLYESDTPPFAKQ